MNRRLQLMDLQRLRGHPGRRERTVKPKEELLNETDRATGGGCWRTTESSQRTEKEKHPRAACIPLELELL